MNNSYGEVLYAGLLDVLIKSLVAGFGVFSLVVSAARVMSVSFRYVAYVEAAILGVVGLLLIRVLWLNRAKLGKRDALQFFLLLMLTAASGLLAGAINAPEEDDSFYVPPVVHSLAWPDKPLGFELEWIVPFGEGERLRFYIGFIGTSIEYFWGSISYLSGLDYLYVYQVIGSIVFGGAFPLVYVHMLSCFFRSFCASYTGATVITIGAYLFFREGGQGFGILLHKIWIGKTVLLVIMIPIVATLAFKHLTRQSFSSWAVLAVAAIAATGCSSSSFFIVPALLAAIAGGNLVFMLSGNRPVREWLTPLSLVMAAFYPLVLGLLFSLGPEVSAISQWSYWASPSGNPFNAAFEGFFGSYLSFTSIALVTSLLYLLYRTAIAHMPLIGWLWASIVFFVNPITANIVAHYITSHVAYARMFLIVPVFPLIGAATGKVVTMLSSNLRLMGLIGGLGSAVAALYLWINFEDWQSHLDVPNKPFHLGAPRLGTPSVRMDPLLIRDVREIEQVLPDGNTLSSPSYDLAIPMLTAKLPQYYIWPIPRIHHYGILQGYPEEARVREGAAYYLHARREYLSDFEKALDLSVENVVLSRVSMNEVHLEEIRATLLRKRFVPLKETNRYLLYRREAGRP